MKSFSWKEYYDRFYDWSSSTQARNLSYLTELGPVSEVAEIIIELQTCVPAANRLLRKAVEAGYHFKADDLIEFLCICDKDTAIAAVNNSISTLSVDEIEKLRGYVDDEGFLGQEQVLQQYIRLLTDRTPSEDVTQLALTLQTAEATELIQAALKAGVRFLPEEILEFAGFISNDLIVSALQTRRTPLTAEQLDGFENYAVDAHVLNSIAAQDKVERAKEPDEMDSLVDTIKELPDRLEELTGGLQVVRQPSRPGFFSVLFGVIADMAASEPQIPKHDCRCNGDCEHCPDHYGYRYGRWYYGKHHSAGCEFGGNDCSGGL